MGGASLPAGSPANRPMSAAGRRPADGARAAGRRFACRDPDRRGGKGVFESPPGWSGPGDAMHLSPPRARFVPAGGRAGAPETARYAAESAAKCQGIRRDAARRSGPRRRPASVPDQRVKAAGHNVPNLQHRLENHAKRRGKGTFLVARPRGLAMVHPRIAVLAFRVGLADNPGVGKRRPSSTTLAGIGTDFARLD
jgi:hypothetical protein